MERISQAQLSNALQPISRPFAERLSEEDGQTLEILVCQMAQRYPSQDLSESIEGYLEDFEALALKYSLQCVKAALTVLRTKPGQTFFPRPDEVAEEIEMQIASDRVIRDRQVQDCQRQRQIDDFWMNLPHMLERTGETEEQFLKRWPSMRGTKPSSREGHRTAKVVSMPSRDRKKAAAGDDSDGAA